MEAGLPSCTWNKPRRTVSPMKTEGCHDGPCQHELCMSGEEQVAALSYTGLKDLHSWAFLGDSGRIATACDGVFLYTPAGPNAQLDLFLRAHELFHCGRLQVQAQQHSGLNSTSAFRCSWA